MSSFIPLNEDIAPFNRVHISRTCFRRAHGTVRDQTVFAIFPFFTSYYVSYRLSVIYRFNCQLLTDGLNPAVNNIYYTFDAVMRVCLINK